MVQDKHNTAVRIITKAIASGGRGADSIVYNDGGNAAKWARSGAAHLHKTVGNIPSDLLSKAQLKAAGSRPDIVLYRRKSVKRTPEGQWMTSQAQITLIEVKYTRDTDPSRTYQDPYQQHESLYEILRQRHPSAVIERKPIIMGVAGAVYAEATVRQLEPLGVKGNLLRSCIHKLQRHAIQSLHEIWKARQESIRKKHVNTSENSAPVEGHLNLGGGVSLGWGAGGDERDQGGGARRAQKRGEG